METEIMSLNQLNNTLGQNVNAGNYLGDWNQCLPLAQTYYHYYPQTCLHWNEPNKFEQAFKIINKLIERKLLEIKTVKQFIETLGDIQSVL